MTARTWQDIPDWLTEAVADAVAEVLRDGTQRDAAVVAEAVKAHPEFAADLASALAALAELVAQEAAA